jgi:hypothetical protein
MTALATTRQPDVREQLLREPLRINGYEAVQSLAGRLRASNRAGIEERAACRDDLEYQTRIVTAVMFHELFRHFFPREFRAMAGRLHECDEEIGDISRGEVRFLTLVEERLFPLPLDWMWDADCEYRTHSVPVMAQQDHDWANFCCSFEHLQLVYQIVLAFRGGEEWDALPALYPALRRCPRPLTPNSKEFWPRFARLCRREQSPLRMLPVVFEMVNYETGNIWIDHHEEIYGEAHVAWTRVNLTWLARQWRDAQAIFRRTRALNEWLKKSPRARIGRAVALWNRAALGKEGKAHV